MNPQLQKVIDDCEKIIADYDKGAAELDEIGAELDRVGARIQAIADKHAKPLTNFEKWKAELTPEKLADTFRRGGIVICGACPCGPHTHCPNAGGCKASILAWANAEAE